MNFIVYFNSLKNATSQICVKLVKYFKRTHLGQLQYLFYKKKNIKNKILYKGNVRIYSWMRCSAADAWEANATCEKLCRRVKWRNI